MTAQTSEALAKPRASSRAEPLLSGPLIIFFIIAIFASLSLSLARLLGARYWLAGWAGPRFAETPAPAYALRLLASILAPLLLLAVEMLLYAIPVLIGWYLARRVAASFLSILYDLPDQDAAHFLRRLAKGTAAGPTLAIRPDQVGAGRLRDPLVSLGGPGRISISAGTLVATERNGRYRRILGPGHHRLEQHETVHSLLDLRPHERKVRDNLNHPAGPLALFTRDGIPLYADVTAIYRICPNADRDRETSEGPPSSLPTRQHPFPFSEQAARCAVYAQTLWGRCGDPSLQEWTWADLAPVIAGEELRMAVSARSLQELIQPEGEQLASLKALQDQTIAGAQSRLQRFGVQLITLRIDFLVLPEAVSELLIGAMKRQA